MYSVKPGRGPSLASAVGGVIVVVFGIGWTILAFVVTGAAAKAANRFSVFSGDGGGVMSDAHIIFPLVGVLFILVGIGSIAYNLFNATAKDRLSMVDIATDQEEPDPLNRRVQNRGRLNQAVSSATASGTCAAPGNEAQLEARLAEIMDLHDRGVISDAELSAQRSRILEGV